jgi:hypothetical protein
MGLITIVPFIINKILTSKLFDIIRESKEMFVKVIISKIFTIIIKFYSKLYLNKDVAIKYTEILCLLKDYRDTVNYFIDILKNLLFIFLLLYIKNYSASLYYGMIKYIYNYKTGDLLASYNADSAKHYLIDIIDNRKWYELTKPNAYKAILYLYQINNEKSDIIKNIVTQFNFSLVKMFTVWTISSLFGIAYIIPILSFGMLLFKKIMNRIDNDKFYKELLVILLSGSLSLMYDNYMIISFLSHFGTQFIFNNVTFIMIKVMYKKLKKIINMIVNNNVDLTMSYIFTIIYTIILKHIAVKDTYFLIGLNILFNIMISIEIKKQIIFAIILLSTYISNYNILHVIFNTLILYIIFGCIDRGIMYTFQDTIKMLLDSTNVIVKNILQNGYMLFSFLYDYYSIVRHFIRNILRDIFVKCIYGKNSEKKIIFDLMDTEKFPSISTFLNKNTDNQNIKVVKLERSTNSNNDSVSFDDKVFDQPIDDFINEISVDDNYEIQKKLNVIKKVDCYEIINNYLDAN